MMRHPGSRSVLDVWGLAVLVMSGMIGCDAPSSNESTSPPEEKTSAASSESPSSGTLQFQYEEAGHFFERLRSRLERIGRPGQHHPPERRGRYRRESWCTPTIPEVTCRTNGEVGRPLGWARASLSAIYPSETAEHPRGWTYLYEDRRTRAPLESLGLRMWLSYRARRVAGNDLRIRLLRFENQTVADDILVGRTYEYDLAETSVRVRPPLEETNSQDGPDELRRLEAELTRLLASPERFQVTVITRLESLRTKALRTLESGEARMCPDESSQESSSCDRPVPLDEAARSKWRERIERDLKRRIELVRQHGEQWHALLEDAMPSKLWSNRHDVPE